MHTCNNPKVFVCVCWFDSFYCYLTVCNVPVLSVVSFVKSTFKLNYILKFSSKITSSWAEIDLYDC